MLATTSTALSASLGFWIIYAAIVILIISSNISRIVQRNEVQNLKRKVSSLEEKIKNDIK